MRADSDPTAPLFFLSYAHSSASSSQANSFVLKFFKHLSEDVAELAGRTASADPGFMDLSSMPGGTRWTPELLHAVGTCQVFVTLLSPWYLSSKWCGMEWDAFSRRQVRSREGTPSNETCIVPVVWAPYREELASPQILAIQRFSLGDPQDADVRQRYEHEGVLGLMKMGRWGSYQTVVWRLAYRIAGIAYNHRVEANVFTQPEELNNLFEG